MDARKILEERYENSEIKNTPVDVPSFLAIPVRYMGGDHAYNLRQDMNYINKHKGFSIDTVGKKGKLVYKFMGFIVAPIVAKQNEFNAKYKVALKELYRLKNQRVQLYNRLNELEAKIAALEIKQ